MPTFWKVLVGLVIALPMAAYVVGSVSVASIDDRAPRDPVRIADVRETPASEKSPGGKEPSAPPSWRTPANGDDEDGEDVRVVTPKPPRVERDDGPEVDDDNSLDGDDDSDDGEDD